MVVFREIIMLRPPALFTLQLYEVPGPLLSVPLNNEAEKEQ